MVSTTGKISNHNRRKDTCATEQVPPEVLFVCKKTRRNFLQYKIAYRAARKILKFPAKSNFWSTCYSACVLYTKKVSVKSDGYLPPLW